MARSSPALRARDRARLAALVRAAPVALPDAVWATVATAYASPGRHYHTLQHLAELARSWRRVAAGPGWADPRASFLALLFHDAVYAVGAPDNEARSAALLLGLVPDAEPAARLIRLTASHGDPGAAAERLDPDAALFLDADLAILGSAPRRFARYEAQVAAEFAAIVPAELYRAGRRAFLTRLAALPRLFRSPLFHDRLEARARANLARVLAEGDGAA